jgi:hypothetical protein
MLVSIRQLSPLLRKYGITSQNSSLVHDHRAEFNDGNYA